MTLTTPYSATFQVGDGELKEFPYLFEEVSESFIRVLVYNSLTGMTSIPTYIVDTDLKKVIFGDDTLAPTADEVVCIYRDTPEVQDVAFRTLHGYDAKTLENILSKIVAMIQEMKSNYFSTQVLQGDPWQLDLLKSEDDGATVNIDYVAKKLVKGLYFRITSGNLQVSADGSTYITMPKSEDVAEFRQQQIELADHTYIYKLQYRVGSTWYDAEANAQAKADAAYQLAETVQTDLSAHVNNQNNPHQTSLVNLTDTNIVNPVNGQFMMFDGLKWKNVYSSATASWGTILGNLIDQTDLTDYISDGLSTKVSTDGSSTMTGVLKMRATSSFQCAIAPFWDGVGFYKLNSDDSVTLIASIETPDGFVPWVTNTYNIGSSLKKWKNLYLDGTAYITKINNGYDLLVPAKSGTLATKEEVDLAANSGRMITDQGVWYAKMYAATVAPSAEDGTNYADFSQTDGQGNPIIVTYNRVNGAWVQDQTITPPAEYDGYVPITSKIWDIAEQAGQQGGRILWNHQSKEFTPYPQIISFEDIEVTGDSTVIMPQNPSASQIVNKDYVDNKFAGDTYHPDLFDWKWADHQLNDVQWLRADTFSWQSGAVYEAAYNHLVDDIDGKTLQSETIAGTTVQFYLADDGHKICPDTQESNVAAIYTATGVAWYYILDTANQRFKLPRSKHNKYADMLGVVGNGKTLGLTNGSTNEGLYNSNAIGLSSSVDGYGKAVYTSIGTPTTFGDLKSIGITTDVSNSGIVAQQTQDTDQYKYLYFYVGSFTQTALENTAGLNAELFNDKVDVGHEVIAFQRPTSANNYTWYRKYADGWVEMGGTGTTTSDTPYKVDLPVTMATQTSYQTFVQGKTTTTGGTGWQVVPLQNTSYPKTSTSFYVQGSISGYNLTFYWRAEGMAA